MKVSITETLVKVIDIDSDDELDALNKAIERYRNCDIVLDAEDMQGVEFNIVK